MTDLRALLAPIRERLAAATPGPWDRPLNTRYRASVSAAMPKGDPASRFRDNADHLGQPERVTIATVPIWSTGKFYRPQSGRDLELIANAPTDLTRLLAAIEAVDALADEWDAIAKGTTQFDSALRVCAYKTRTALAAALGSDTTNQEAPEQELADEFARNEHA